MNTKGLSKENVEYLLKICKDPESITLSLIKEIFADTEKSNKKFDFEDTLILPAKTINNKDSIKTTAGRVLVNAILFNGIYDKQEFVNKPFTSGVIKGFSKDLIFKMLEDEITIDQYNKFIDRCSWLGWGASTFTIPTFDSQSQICPPKTAKLRKELFKKHSKEIENGDLKVVSDIENQLMESVREELKGSPILDLYDSGSKGKFGNNYKNTVLMRGIVPDFIHPGKFEVNLDNLSDGNSPENQYKGANTLVNGAAGRSIETRVGGL